MCVDIWSRFFPFKIDPFSGGSKTIFIKEINSILATCGRSKFTQNRQHRTYLTLLMVKDSVYALKHLFLCHYVIIVQNIHLPEL